MSSRLNASTRNRRLRTVGGLLLGGGLLVAYVAVIGVDAVQRALWTVPPRRILSLLCIGGVSLFFWSVGLFLVLDRLGRPVTLWTAVLLFSASGFLNSVTPFGQVGGDPPTAVLFGRAIGTDFETGLAAIGSVNALNRIAAVFLGLLGIAYLGSHVPAAMSLRTASVVVAALAIALALVLVAGWTYRDRLVEAAARLLTPLARALVVVVPGVSPPSRAEVERRGRRFVGAVDRLAAEPRLLAVVFGLSVAGQLAVASTLWVALAALGFDTPVAVVLLLIPLAKLAGVAPTPGGFGSAEALLTTLLVSTTPVHASVAGAAVLLYRACAFWFPSLVGGVALGWFTVVGRAASAVSEESETVARESRVDHTGPAPATSRSTVPQVLLAVAVSLAVLTVVVIHRSHLLVEPENIVVHAVRDSAVVLLTLLLTWALLRRLPRRFSG